MGMQELETLGILAAAGGGLNAASQCQECGPCTDCDCSQCPEDCPD